MHTILCVIPRPKVPNRNRATFRPVNAKCEEKYVVTMCAPIAVIVDIVIKETCS
ncbi:hypothetical protein DPMN_072130 [Dreissena polymorpha]|uniref:Uncharacterized protein n=1 Tax=Dreissena polymorpha TaxID=45954 RepID=A0A9D4BW96_DREPO|nr:hypothetical protein DPMN_072130 [Dreissena polymorpha]